MAIMDLIMDYVVPVVSGIFFLIFLSVFGYIVHKAVLQPLRVYDKIKNLILSMKKNKILGDNKVIEYCVLRIDKGWNEVDVRKELLLANKYSEQKIEEIIFAFNTIQKEMKGEKKKVAQDLP